MSSPQFSSEELLGLYLNVTNTLPMHPGKSSWTAQKQQALTDKLDLLVNGPKTTTAVANDPEFVIVRKFENKYHCEACDESWTDVWCCACDDECPTCGKAHSPEDSIVLKTFRLKLKTETCEVCNSTHDF